MSKVIERVVAKQLNQFLETEELLPNNQSAYHKRHSTETTMLRVLSDALAAADRQQVTLIRLLDLKCYCYSNYIISEVCHAQCYNG